MPKHRRPNDLYTFVWVRGPHGPEPQVWGEEPFHAPAQAREGIVLATRRLTPDECALSLRQLAARYPAPADPPEA
ncbi:hypothetical protein [Bradyrhizobium sp. 2TAF24]